MPLRHALLIREIDNKTDVENKNIIKCLILQ